MGHDEKCGEHAREGSGGASEGIVRAQESEEREGERRRCEGDEGDGHERGFGMRGRPLRRHPFGTRTRKFIISMVVLLPKRTDVSRETLQPLAIKRASQSRATASTARGSTSGPHATVRGWLRLAKRQQVGLLAPQPALFASLLLCRCGAGRPAPGCALWTSL